MRTYRDPKGKLWTVGDGENPRASPPGNQDPLGGHFSAIVFYVLVAMAIYQEAKGRRR